MVFEDPLDGLEEVGAQREGALQGRLPLPEKLGQRFAPHALGQGRHRAAGPDQHITAKLVYETVIRAIDPGRSGGVS